MKRLILLVVLSALVLALAVLSADAYSFRSWVELSHPEVRWIDSTSLAQRLEEGDVTLIDVRTAQEYETSHLPGALRVGATPPRGQEVVVYCSLGVRSADHAERLKEQGYAVLNLDGGIFAWAGEGHPIENDSGATREVHPYNAFFGLFLDVE